MRRSVKQKPSPPVGNLISFEPSEAPSNKFLEDEPVIDLLDGLKFPHQEKPLVPEPVQCSLNESTSSLDHPEVSNSLGNSLN